MTFTEAAIEVLRREGKPLHFKKITEIAIRENLLDHVGKIPEEVMADQVAAHCRLPKLERRMVAVQPGTFALVEWDLEEDPLGLENLVEPPPVDDLPYRARERHPAPIRDAGRGGREAREPREPRDGREKPRRRDEGGERHGRRFPPPAEVAYEILAGEGQPLTLAAIAAQGAERLLMPEAFVRDTGALGAALAEDNRRRESAGRRPLFEVEGETVRLLAQPEGGERPAALPVGARATASELRRVGLAALRRKLRECDQGTVEHLAQKLLEQAGYKELKVAKRGREHVIFTGRKRMGLADVRHCFRVLRTGAEAARRDVQDTRRDLGNYGAQIGVVLTAGEAGREARAEAGAAGQLPVILLCGEALAEAFADAGLGCTTVAVPEIDEAFFASAAEVAGREEEMRRARREERDRREGREGRSDRPDRGERTEAGDRPEREPREPREPRPPREPREPREAREPGEPRGSREERAGEPGRTPAPAVEESPSEGGEAMLVAVEAAAAAPAFEGAPAPAAVLEPSDGPDGDEGDDGEEGDDDSDGGAEEAGGEGSASGGEGAAPGPNGEPRPAGEGGRKRRRRRRRRGGRGRGERREGAPAGEGGSGQGGGTPAGEGSGGAAAPAAGGASDGGGSAGSGGEGSGGASGGDAPDGA